MRFTLVVRFVVFGLLLGLFVLTQQFVSAGSTGLSIVAFSGGACSMNGGTTNFTVRIAYNSAASFNYVASIVSGPAGLGGTSGGTIPAGSSANTPLGLLFNSVFTAAPWSFVVQIDTSVGGSPQDRATATVSCPSAAGPYTVTPIASIDISVVPSVPVPAAAPACISDARINRSNAVDCAAPVAVYHADGGFSVYGINPTNAQGTLSLVISSARIAEVGVPDENTLLAEGTIAATGQPIWIYRLASGEYQLNTFYADGKPYVIAWDENGNMRYLAN